MDAFRFNALLLICGSLLLQGALHAFKDTKSRNPTG
jgi:hypothetical protein